MHYKLLNKLLIEILEDIRGFISEDLYETNKEYILVGEPGIALDNMCSYIDEYNIEISLQTFKKIEEAGYAMEMDPNTTWMYLEKHIVK